jgi:hypothetical protein
VPCPHPPPPPPPAPPPRHPPHRGTSTRGPFSPPRPPPSAHPFTSLASRYLPSTFLAASSSSSSCLLIPSFNPSFVNFFPLRRSHALPAARSHSQLQQQRRRGREGGGMRRGGYYWLVLAKGCQSNLTNACACTCSYSIQLYLSIIMSSHCSQLNLINCETTDVLNSY